MSSTPHAPRTAHRCTWLRLLILLLALSLPSPHVEAGPVLAPTLSTEQGTPDPDIFETWCGPTRKGHRPVAPIRPTPRPTTAFPLAADHPHPVRQRPPHTPHVLRSVVLRC